MGNLDNEKKVNKRNRPHFQSYLHVSTGFCRTRQCAQVSFTLSVPLVGTMRNGNIIPKLSFKVPTPIIPPSANQWFSILSVSVSVF